MNWLHAAGFALALPFGLVLVAACSNDDSATSTGQMASQPPVTKFEAGTGCATSNDCETGLTCRYPATGCSNFRICAPAPPATCSNQVACTCLAETITLCDGYSDDPIDSLGACGDGGAIVVTDSGGSSDGAVVDSTVPVTDASDATVPVVDSSSPGTTDASDATPE